jgi:lysozyme
MRKTSQRGIDLIKKWEGCRLIPYQCQAGVFTVGYGCTTKTDIGPITQEYAEELLRKDLERFEIAICSLVRVPLTQNEFDALVSFTFNVGITAFQSSMLLAQLNDGSKPAAAKQILRWHHIKEKDSKGLTKRREDEYALFCS